jgi:uncharacterized membrane protein
MLRCDNAVLLQVSRSGAPHGRLPASSHGAAAISRKSGCVADGVRAMIALALAALFLLLSHFLIASTQLRGLLVRRLGERAYSLGYSLLALAAFAWLIVAYRHAPALRLWSVPRWVVNSFAPVMLVSSILVVAGLTTPNPVIVRSQGLFGEPAIVRGVLRITRNPFFWGVGLFAAAHVIIIGDVAATIAFGSVAFLGLAGGPMLDAKKAAQHGPSWDAFAAVTSNIPFLAIVQGRQRLAWAEIGLWRLVSGVGLFAAALVVHQTLFGGNPIADFWRT